MKARGCGVLLLLAMAAPLALALVASLRPESELQGASTAITLTLEHYRALFTEHHFVRPILNSLFVAACTTALAVPLATACAYALARMPFRGRGAVLALVLAVTMFPQVSIVSPLYLLLRAVGLVDTYPGLVLPYLTFAMPLAVWLLVGHLRALPRELEEAAFVDGASRLRTLVEIVAPPALPGIVTTAILTFVYCWNELLFALAFTVGDDHRTVPVAIALFRGQYQVPWGEILAGAIVASLPVVLLVLAVSRRVVSGLTGGGVKG
ncbi:carbohydrate ABC transporter permease [Sandaracinus amylolyticus]|uniref:Maltose/maltodextrin ABC transporter, permease protein MalG n=1 Tax=Sandaracinus amylolyticus TaxID=927083 RepID=A0A0F6WAD8_9BACT|nr:carbohydrate ABC transporter permease [Sandaracinus amylolyticus]AKF11427.1 Maltose/maltodextrin ABC transporter, permease protein MalG [Sandaracinus amylolyticus]